MALNQWINYHHLYYFRAIAMEGSIAKAARKLRLGQPTLSTQLKVFEESLGHQLFSRQHKRLALTEAGRAALEYANEIFRLGDEMLEVLDDKLGPEQMSVQIGVLDTLPKNLSQQLVEQALGDNNCVVTVVEGHGDELLRELKAHRIDLIVTNYPPPVGDSGGVHARSIGKMPVIVCGTRNFIGLKRNFPASLSDQPFVLPTLHSRLRQDLDHYFKTRNIKVNVRVEAQDTSLQKLLATKGIGITALAEAAAKELIDSKQLLQLGVLESVYEEVWLIGGERRLQNPVAAKLMKSFRL